MKAASVINVSETPAVSLIIPTDKSYPQYKTHEEQIKHLLNKIEKELSGAYPETEVEKITGKLQTLVDSIDHKKLQKGLALYVSPEKARVIYLPFTVNEKTIIDSSFEVRDVLYSAKNSISYMVLLLRGHKPEIYSGYNSTLIRETSNGLPAGTESAERDYSSRVSNFSDPSEIKETALDNYLKTMDHVLTERLKAITVPVIVCGAKRTLGHFRKISRNNKNISGFVEKDFTYHSKQEIYEAIAPVLTEKIQQGQQNALQLLEESADKKTCVYGIKNVWRAAAEKQGKLLIVEKNYTCKAWLKAQYTLQTDNIEEIESNLLQDAVDDTIELVLKNSGDIVFVDDGKLKDYGSIALIKYY